jgi:hypothetical protein
MASATYCASLALGMCDVPKYTKGKMKGKSRCYALGAEIQYTDVLPYRMRQTRAWKSDFTIFDAEIKCTQRVKARGKNPIKYVRFNESGDFGVQADVDKLCTLAELNPTLKFYGYTARKDWKCLRFPLNYTRAAKVKNLCINGSGWNCPAGNTFGCVEKFTVPEETKRSVKLDDREYKQCPGQTNGGCRNCDLCKTDDGLYIENIVH